MSRYFDAAPKQSEQRIERCKSAFNLALEFCGDNDRALDWFYADAPAFEGKSPIDLAFTVPGFEKLQGFITDLRTAIAASSGASGENDKPSVPLNRPHPSAEAKTKPIIPDVVPATPEKRTEAAANDASQQHQAGLVAAKATAQTRGAEPRQLYNGSYIPGGMARSRSQAVVHSEPPTDRTAYPTEAPLAANITNDSGPVQAEPATPKKDLSEAIVNRRERSPTEASVESETNAPENKVPVALNQPTQRTSGVQPPPPPPGVDPEKRIFRLKEPLSLLREKRPDLTIKDVSDAMMKRGFTRFAVQSHASRLFKSYTWATWTEVVHLADIFEGDPYELGSVQSE